MADETRRDTGRNDPREQSGADTGSTRDGERVEGAINGICCPIEFVDRGNRDPDFERAQRDAGGDYTSDITGGFPVGESVELSGDNLPDYLPGDEVDDIPTQDRNHPGTIDDIPYSVDEANPSDKPPLEPLASGDEETDLWNMQRPLIDEDRETGYEVFGVPEDRVPLIADALGEDAAEDSQGNSVTAEGSPYTPAHGGFPERQESRHAGAAPKREPDTRDADDASTSSYGDPDAKPTDR